MHLGAGCAVARRGGQGCWLFGGSGGHLRGVLVPPCDPEAQTTFSPPPRSRSMVFHNGARALWGLRRSVIFARGEGQQRADLSSPPQSESVTRAWQVLGYSRMHLLVVCGMLKRRVGQARKDNWSTRVAVRERPEAPRLLFSSRGSHNILGCSVFYASVMVHGGPLRGALNKILGSLHGCGASCARIMPKCWL